MATIFVVLTSKKDDNFLRLFATREAAETFADAVRSESFAKGEVYNQTMKKLSHSVDVSSDGFHTASIYERPIFAIKR